jgi:serine/threonine protein kinase
VFYEILEGRRPFEAESFSEMCVKVAVDPPAPMVNTPPALQQVILKCLAKQAEQRYATMAELGADLIPFVTDGHQAQRLVERMTRMLRRSQHNWDDNSSSVRRVSDREASGAMRAPKWNTGSDPAVSPWRAKSEPAAQPLPRADSPRVLDPAEQYVSAPSTIMTTQPRRRWPVALGLAVLVGAGIVLGVVLSGSKPDESTTSKVVVPAGSNVEHEQPKLDTQAPKVDVSKATVPDGSNAAPKNTGSASIASTSAGAGSASAEIAKPEANHTPNIRKPAAGTGTKTRPKTTQKGEVKPPPDKTPAGEGSAAAAPPCDPFNHQHGCVDKSKAPN